MMYCFHISLVGPTQLVLTNIGSLRTSILSLQALDSCTEFICDLIQKLVPINPISSKQKNP